MKSRRETEELLRKELPILRTRFKVARIGIFGSVVRDEQTPSSDVDILVEFTEPVDWEFIDLKDHLETLLGVKVDLVTVPALKPQLRDEILAEVVFA